MRPGTRPFGLLAAGMVIMLIAFPSTTPAAAQTGELPPGGTFVDDDGTAAEGFIEAVAAEGITTGCNPPAGDRFCPDQTVTRAELATMLARALALRPAASDFFVDDNGSAHEASINSLAEAGITGGCGTDRFCGSAPVTRGELATFLVRAFDLPAADTDLFFDDSLTIHEASINALAAAGITRGCATGRFCPYGALPRRQAAVFLARALDLNPLTPPARPFPSPPDVGQGKRIIYANAQQRIWMIDQNDTVVDSYLVSGREGVPDPGTYTVYSKSPLAWSHHGITMEHMVRFAYGRTASIGFHAIPRRSDGEPMQSEDELGQFLSAGCVRQSDAEAEALYAWTPIGTVVIVVP